MSDTTITVPPPSACPPEYLAAIGHVVSTWGFYEARLADNLDYLRLLPEVRALTPIIWKDFRKRADLFERSAHLAFQGCPELCARISAITETAKRLSEQRNTLCHGRWFPAIGPHPVTVSIRRKQQWFFYYVSLEHLISLWREIAEMMDYQMWLFISAGDAGAASWLSSQEISALRDFHRRTLMTPPTRPAQKPRHLPFRE